MAQSSQAYITITTQLTTPIPTYSLSDTLPVYAEICKRSMKFIATTLVSSNKIIIIIASRHDDGG